MYFYSVLNFCLYLQQCTKRVCSGGVDNVVINGITELACLKQKCSCCRCASNQNVGLYSILEHIQCSDMGGQWLRGRLIAEGPRVRASLASLRRVLKQEH